MLPVIAFAELLVCWILWIAVFVVQHKRITPQKPVQSAPVARWGIAFQMLGYALVWSYVRPAEFSELLIPKPMLVLIASMLLGPASVVLAWFAVRHLGKQWRVEAALSEDHELVRTGPYVWLRHPIYTSMFGMLLATALAWTWWPMIVAGVATFLIGTEIRVRVEDRLLSTRFKESFTSYRGSAAAYIPFIR